MNFASILVFSFFPSLGYRALPDAPLAELHTERAEAEKEITAVEETVADKLVDESAIEETVRDQLAAEESVAPVILKIFKFKLLYYKNSKSANFVINPSKTSNSKHFHFEP